MVWHITAPLTCSRDNKTHERRIRSVLDRGYWSCTNVAWGIVWSDNHFACVRCSRLVSRHLPRVPTLLPYLQVCRECLQYCCRSCKAPERELKLSLNRERRPEVFWDFQDTAFSTQSNRGWKWRFEPYEVKPSAALCWQEWSVAWCGLQPAAIIHTNACREILVTVLVFMMNVAHFSSA